MSRNLPVPRFMFLAAMAVAMPWIEAVEALPTWNDQRAAAFAASRTVPCPCCNAASGERCTGVGAQAGEPMRMHHSGRILHTTAIYAFPEEIDIPLIPYKVLENKKRPPAASTVLGGTPTQEATGGQSFT